MACSFKRPNSIWFRAHRHNPDIPFERYADDVICHCRSEAQARTLREAREARLAACKLQRHACKTKIVYCKDANWCGNYPEQRFDFLGYVFRPRRSMNATVSCSSVSLRRCAPRRPKRYGNACDAGSCICATILPWKCSHSGRGQYCSVGFASTVTSIRTRCIERCARSIGFWFDGRNANTNDFEVTKCAHGLGLTGFEIVPKQFRQILRRLQNFKPVIGAPGEKR